MQSQTRALTIRMKETLLRDLDALGQSVGFSRQALVILAVRKLLYPNRLV